MQRDRDDDRDARHVPAAHGTQAPATDDPAGDSEPTGHGRHTSLVEAPVVVLYVLTGHAVQRAEWLDAVTSLQVPAAQEKHRVRPVTLLNVPGRQAVHSVDVVRPVMLLK
jgi:hypothetical protein